MPPIRATDMIARKWSRVAGQSAPSYQEGLETPLADFAANALAAEPAWEQGVQAAVGNKTFASGVRRTGTAKWQKNALAKGPARYTQGVGLAAPDYQAGFDPYRETIQATRLSPRGPRRSPQNRTRFTEMVDALSARKEALQRGGR